MQRLINWEQKITKLGKVTMQISVENALEFTTRVASEDETISQFFKQFAHFCLEIVLTNLYSLGLKRAC